MYQNEKIGGLEEHEYFSVDESNVGHKKGKALWLLGIIKNSTKEFTIQATYGRDTATIKRFISKFVDKGNTIISDGWNSYNDLDSPDSSYIHVKHIHSAGSFEAGILSTSHIEFIWAQIKAKIKETYHSIPNKYIIHYIKEAEFKISLKNKNAEDKSKEFFDIYEFLQNVSDVEFEKNSFYRDSDESSSDLDLEDE